MLLDFLQVLLRQPEFTIRIDRGSARLWQGKAPPRFVSECDLIAREAELSRGLIFGLGTKGSKLGFSGIPASHQQRFRNVWGIYR